MKRFFLLVFISVCFISPAQNVVNSNGQTISGGGYTVDYSLGEVITQTISNGTNIATQGFLQPFVHTTVVKENDEKLTLVVFPNPTAQKLNVRFSGKENVKVRFVLNDIAGKTVLAQDVTSNENSVDVSSLAAGQYILSLTNSLNGKTNTYKIIKEQK